MSSTKSAEAQAQRIQEFRYVMVAELTNVYLEHGELCRLIREKSTRIMSRAANCGSSIPTSTDA